MAIFCGPKETIQELLKFLKPVDEEDRRSLERIASFFRDEQVMEMLQQAWGSTGDKKKVQYLDRVVESDGGIGNAEDVKDEKAHSSSTRLVSGRRPLAMLTTVYRLFTKLLPEGAEGRRPPAIGSLWSTLTFARVRYTYAAMLVQLAVYLAGTVAHILLLERFVAQDRPLNETLLIAAGCSFGILRLFEPAWMLFVRDETYRVAHSAGMIFGLYTMRNDEAVNRFLTASTGMITGALAHLSEDMLVMIALLIRGSVIEGNVEVASAAITCAFVACGLCRLVWFTIVFISNTINHSYRLVHKHPIVDTLKALFLVTATLITATFIVVLIVLFVTSIQMPLSVALILNIFGWAFAVAFVWFYVSIFILWPLKVEEEWPGDLPNMIPFCAAVANTERIQPKVLPQNGSKTVRRDAATSDTIVAMRMHQQTMLCRICHVFLRMQGRK
eukprot:CAMPEP_0114491282 /NCGR_PEP_ID=MMETSP0109-20121206/2915_1 /TAXON_ID=29199 /ORGANISM="Chlorarachnion reptans, Strain CCCM449" /LENGTH=442 /DNA_ID=CAMNT_0001668001 /DNA_START=70 /DNA_END=1397 /DNA_ORIENTATION=+